MKVYVMSEHDIRNKYPKDIRYRKKEYDNDWIYFNVSCGSIYTGCELEFFDKVCEAVMVQPTFIRVKLNHKYHYISRKYCILLEE